MFFLDAKKVPKRFSESKYILMAYNLENCTLAVTRKEADRVFNLLEKYEEGTQVPDTELMWGIPLFWDEKKEKYIDSGAKRARFRVNQLIIVVKADYFEDYFNALFKRIS